MPDARSASSSAINGGALVAGLVIGLGTGAVLALWKAPLSGEPLRRRLFGYASEAQAQVSQRLEQAVPSDPLADSLQAGRAAARRRLNMDESGVLR